jgi:hypothetical protein
MSWTTPPFEALPASTDPRFRWAGTHLLDEEQFRVEGWQRSVQTFPDKYGAPQHYWRPSVEGCEASARLRADRKTERKAVWQSRQESDDEWSEHVASLVDGGVAW